MMCRRYVADSRSKTERHRQIEDFKILLWEVEEYADDETQWQEALKLGSEVREFIKNRLDYHFLDRAMKGRNTQPSADAEASGTAQ